jgi:hypothetical protein
LEVLEDSAKRFKLRCPAAPSGESRALGWVVVVDSLVVLLMTCGPPLAWRVPLSWYRDWAPLFGGLCLTWLIGMSAWLACRFTETTVVVSRSRVAVARRLLGLSLTQLIAASPNTWARWQIVRSRRGITYEIEVRDATTTIRFGRRLPLEVQDWIIAHINQVLEGNVSVTQT